MYSRDELFLRSFTCYFGVYKHQNNPLVSVETVRHSSIYNILYMFTNVVCKADILFLFLRSNAHGLTLEYYVCWRTYTTQIARIMGPTWGPPGSWRPHVGPMLGPLNLAIRVRARLGLPSQTIGVFLQLMGHRETIYKWHSMHQGQATRTYTIYHKLCPWLCCVFLFCVYRIKWKSI